MDPKLMSMFASDGVRQIITELARRRTASFHELKASLPNGPSLPEGLKSLQANKLVGVAKSGNIPEFDTYFLTAEGLRSYRALANSFALA